MKKYCVYLLSDTEMFSFKKIFALPRTRRRTRAPCSGGQAHPDHHHHDPRDPRDPLDPPHEDHHDKYTRTQEQAL